VDLNVGGPNANASLSVSGYGATKNECVQNLKLGIESLLVEMKTVIGMPFIDVDYKGDPIK
jgi:hypothetical protein